MAAVQQRSPTEPLSSDSNEKKDSKFIESMEDEVRRCAEHLQRRQSRRGFRSLDRRAINGYSSSSGSYVEDSLDSGARSNSSKMKTLPHSFTLPSDPEERSVLSPRVIAPGGGRTPRKSPVEVSKTHVFKFSTNGTGSNHSGALPGKLQHLVFEEQDCSPAGYHKSISAPPETSPFFSSGSAPPETSPFFSSGSSRENSLTPLQSPLGRMPIGAVYSHPCRPSHSSSSPPPVLPKRLSASPPPVPPKPSKGRARRAKSHPPLSHRSHTPRKVEVSSVRNDALKLSSPPPPLDPIAISTEDSDDEDKLEFPSAEIDLSSFHEKVLRAKLLLGGDSSATGNLESSVDVDDDMQPAVPTSAPPTVGPSSPKVGTSADRVGGAPAEGKHELSTSSSSSEVATEPKESPESSCKPPVAEHAEAPPKQMAPSFEKPDIGTHSQELASKGSASDPMLSDLSFGDPSSSPSISDPYISDPSVRDSSLSVDEQLLSGSRGTSETKVDGEVVSVESHGEKNPEKTRHNEVELPPSDSKLPASNYTPDDHKEPSVPVEIGGQKEDIDVEVPADGKSLSDESEDVFITPSGSMSVSAADTEASGPEIKSIPLQSRIVGQHVSRRSKNSKHSQQAKLEGGGDVLHGPVKAVSDHSPEKSSDSEALKSNLEATTSQKLVSESMQLAGVSESVAIFIKGLQIRLREKEEDCARAQRQHERELKERDEKVKKFIREAKKVEREKWELLKRARDAAERSLHLRTQLDTKEGSLRSIQGELDRTRDELVSVKSANTSLRALLSELRTSRSSVDMAVQVELTTGSLRRNRSIELAFSQGGFSQEQDDSFERTSYNRVSSGSLGLQWPERWERDVISVDSSSLLDENRETTPAMGNYQPLGSRESRKSRKKGAFFSKMRRSSGSKRGSKTSLASTDGLDLSQSSLIQGFKRSSVPIGSPYQSVPSELKEHWRVLEEAKDTPFVQWELKEIVAWVEAGLGMGQYSRAVAEKFPSGAAMLAVGEAEMEKKLGITNSLHRRKLSLALREKKAPQMCQYPYAGKIEHGWVAFEWAHDCGLAHLTEALMSHLVDGRVLNSLTKDDLKRYLKITKKVDQLSFLSGVELLRMHEFNREAIQEHRRHSNNPLYWTNRDVSDWLHHIDLQDYANNVIGGGVHGALLFLERGGRFTSDHLANIIQIPISKSQLRRHLTGKMVSLFSEDVSGSMDHLAAHPAMFSSPLNLSPGYNNSGSLSPIRRTYSPSKTPTPTPGSGSTTPTRDIHPSRKNSLNRRSFQMTAVNSVLRASAPSPPGIKRAGSNPSMAQMMRGPSHFQRSQLDSAERARLSLRESASQSLREDTPPHRTTTPTVLSTPAGTTV